MINKNKFSIQDTKKVLHKVGKQWVVVSAVLLGLVAGGTTVSQMNVSADVVQPTIQKSQDVNMDPQKNTSNNNSVQSGKSSANDTNASTSCVPSISSSNTTFSSASNASSTSQSTDSELPSSNSDSIDKNLSSALNVDELYDAVQNHKNNYNGDYGLFSVMTDVPNLNSDNVYNVTPTNLLSFLNDLNGNLQGYAINNIGIKNLSNHINKILDNVSRSLSKTDDISLKTFLYNLHDNIYIISDNYKEYDNDDKNIVSITPYLNRLRSNSINIAGYNISNPHPLSNNDVYSIAMIMNDMGNIRSNGKANDSYENIFNILNDYVENHKDTQNSSGILDMISNNLSNIIKEANLPNDTFSNALNSLSVATKSKASSVNNSIASRASSNMNQFSNSLANESNYASLIATDVNNIQSASSAVASDITNLTNDNATNASSMASYANKVTQHAYSLIYSSQENSASKVVNSISSAVNSLSRNASNVFGNDDYVGYNTPILSEEMNIYKASSDINIDHINIPASINDNYDYGESLTIKQKSGIASLALSNAYVASKAFVEASHASSVASSMLNESIANSAAQSADQKIEYSYENSVFNSVSEMNSKTADSYAKSANQSIGNSYQKSVADSVANANSSEAQSAAYRANHSLDSSIASSYARSTNQSIANSYQNSVSDSVAKANNSKAKSAAHKADQNLESSIAQSYANSANQSIANSYKNSVASVNSERARSASQSVKDSIASADASKAASTNISPGNLLPNINIPNTSNVQTPLSSSSTQISQMSDTDDISATSSSNASLSSNANQSTKRANSNYLKNNDFKHTSKHKSIVSTKGFYEYKRNHNGKMKRVAFVKPGDKLAIKRVVHNGKITKLELTNGHIITANRDFVKLANVKKTKRTSAYTKALRKITYRTHHGHRFKKFRARRAMKRLVTANKVKAKAQSKFNHRRTVRNHRALNRAIKKLNRIEKTLLK